MSTHLWSKRYGRRNRGDKGSAELVANIAFPQLCTIPLQREMLSCKPCWKSTGPHFLLFCDSHAPLIVFHFVPYFYSRFGWLCGHFVNPSVLSLKIRRAVYATWKTQQINWFAGENLRYFWHRCDCRYSSQLRSKNILFYLASHRQAFYILTILKTNTVVPWIFSGSRFRLPLTA